jgi:hypothetical protein
MVESKETKKAAMLATQKTGHGESGTGGAWVTEAATSKGAAA